MQGHQLHKRILVAYDGSDNAKRAVRSAIAVAKGSKGELRILVVADRSVYMADSMGVLHDQIRENLMEQVQSFLSDAISRAKQAGLAKVHGSVVEGNPPDVILAVASEEKADLIVVGRRGMRGIERFLMGGVSSKVIDNADCDVLVVK